MAPSPTPCPSGSIHCIPEGIDGSARRASLQVLKMAFLPVDGFKSCAALFGVVAKSVFSCLILNADGSILSAKKKLVQDDDPT